MSALDVEESYTFVVRSGSRSAVLCRNHTMICSADQYEMKAVHRYPLTAIRIRATCEACGSEFAIYNTTTNVLDPDVTEYHAHDNVDNHEISIRINVDRLKDWLKLEGVL